MRNKCRKVKTKDRVDYFRKVIPVRSKEPVLQEANSSLWEVRVDLLFSHGYHQVGVIQSHMGNTFPSGILYEV